MKFMKHPMLIVAVIVLSAAAAWTNYAQNKTSQQKIAWEYKEAVNLSPLQMDALGSQGWEMLSYSADGNGNRYMCFKRPK